MEKYIRVLNAIDDNWKVCNANVPADTDHIQEVEKWCEKYCHGEWVNVYSKFYLKEDKDVTFFILRWA